mgnify:FL=1
MEDEEIQGQETDPKKIAAQKREAALAARQAAIKKRNDLIATKRAELAATKKAKLEARAKAMAERRAAINAKKQEGLDARQAKIDKNNSDIAMEKEYNSIEKKRRNTEQVNQEKEDNYDWNYVGGDANTANKRQRTEIIEGEKEVERIIKGSKEINTFKPTGKTDEDVYNADPSLKKKYPTFSSFRIAAQKFRDDQVKTVETEEKVIEKVPTREEKVITQTREDWIKKQSWADGLPEGMVGSLARSMRKRGEDMTPQQLYDLFKSQASEKESAEWARKNGFDYLLGGRGSRGSSTTRGKTKFN